MAIKQQLIIATRESPLALWQAEWVKERLEASHPGLEVRLLGMTTSGDKTTNRSDSKGGKGLFVKELEEALLDGRADIAVHSMKDVPMELPAGLILRVICERGHPGDVFVSNRYTSWAELPSNAVVGTSSLRRQCQMLALRPDITVKALHGNVGTRLSKLDSGEFDALILAAAGLIRLGWQQRIKTYFDPEQLLPAAGQGALGIECRQDDRAVQSIIDVLNHQETATCVLAERIMCQHLGGGCHVPIGAYATMKNQEVTLHGLVADVESNCLLKVVEKAPMDKVAQLGKQAAEALLQKGAANILQDYRV